VSKSIEERLWDSHKAKTELRRLFDAYTDPQHEFWGLVPVLSSIQKAYGPCDWIAKVNDVMRAMEMHDAGLFPDRWFDELDGGAE
jgi:hypothetical protein